MSALESKNLRPVLLAILVHVALLAVLVVGVDWARKSTRPQGQSNVIPAVAVDEEKVTAELERLEKAEQKRQAEAKRAEQQRIEEQRRLEALRRKSEQEQRAAAELQRKQAAEAEHLAQIKREREALAKQREEEAKRLAEIEAQRKMAEEQRRAAEEQLRKAQEEQRRKEAEQALQEQLALEQQQLKAEREQRLQTLREQYIAAIADKVERNWIRPAGAVAGLSCTVQVQQIPGGEVVAASVSDCNADAIVQRSVQTAVYKASPLPEPPDPALFDRNIIFVFAPSE